MMLEAAALAASLLRPGFTAAAPGEFGSPAWVNAVHERFEQTDLYLLEDRESVYVAFAASAATADPGDAVTLYLWSDKAAYAFTVDARGQRSATCSAGASALPKWAAQEHAAKDGYTVTIQLPRTLFSGGQSHWLAQFARSLPQSHVAYTWPESSGEAANVIYSASFDASQPGAAFAAAPAAAAEPKVTAAGAKGVSVTQTRENFALSARAAQSPDGAQNAAASVGWTSPDQHASAGIERSVNADRGTTAIMQALTVGYDNQQDLRVSAGVSGEDGTNVTDASRATYDYYDFSLYGKTNTLDMRWNAAGPQYDGSIEGASAGTTGYTLTVAQAFGNVSLDAAANRYHDDLGKLANADERASITAALNSALTFDVSAAANAATPYTTLPYLQDSAGLRFAKDGRLASVAFHEDHFQNGLPDHASLSSALTLPLLGRNSSISAGYQNASGTSSLTFSFDDRLPIGLLRATYDNPNMSFSAPNFSIKFVRL